MTYRHTVYTESAQYEKLASLACEAAALLTGLPYVPQCHFFKEDPGGRYPRAVRCLGFIDHRSHASNLDIFVRGGLSASEIVETVLHETKHVAEFAKPNRLSNQENEIWAFWFGAGLSPSGHTYEKVFGELAFKLTKEFIRRSDLENARKVSP